MAARQPNRFARMASAAMKALESTPAGLLTLRDGRGGITPNASGAFAGSGMFGFPRSSYVDGYFYTLQNASYGYMWRTQPAIRQVVGAIASNFAQVTLRLYEETSAGVEEDKLHPAIASIRRPNDWQDDAELLEGMASDLLVYENAYLLMVRPKGADRVTFVRLPPYSMGVRGANKLKPDGYRIIFADGTFEDLEPRDVVHWRGYDAIDPRTGWSRMETLRQELIAEATRMAADIEFNRGGRVKGGIIQRPLDAPELDDTGRTRIEEHVGQRMRGVVSGGQVMLDEGMEWVDAGITPREAEMIESRQLAVVTVANVYGLHPALFGIRTGDAPALPEARKQLYEDVLPPLMRRCAGVLTRSVIEGVYGDNTRRYEFDLKEKLEGNLVERLAKAVTIAGRPVMTANEVRDTFFNLPPKPGGDELIVPMNVTVGGLPSPNTMPPAHATSGAGQEPAPDSPAATAPEPAKAEVPEHLRGIPEEFHSKALPGKGAAPIRFRDFTPEDGAAYTKAMTRREAARQRHATYASDITHVVRKHIARQVASLNGKADTPRFDTARWDEELAADLLEVSKSVVEAEGTKVAEHLMGSFNMDEVQHYLEAGAKAAAQGINAATQHQLERAEEEAAKGMKADSNTIADGVLAVAGSHADQVGDSRATALAGFATLEAARQNPGVGGTSRMKSWVWSGSANSRHGGLSNETVPVYSFFSNGGQYPGDPALGTEETAKCRCALDVY